MLGATLKLWSAFVLDLIHCRFSFLNVGVILVCATLSANETLLPASFWRKNTKKTPIAIKPVNA